MSEIKVQAKKNIDTRFDAKRKKLRGEHRKTMTEKKKADYAEGDQPTIIKAIKGVLSPKTKKQRLWAKAKKIDKRIKSWNKTQDEIDSGKISIKHTGDYDKLLKTGAYRDKKGGQVLDYKKPFKGGGIAVRGLGRAFMKGGKV